MGCFGVHLREVAEYLFCCFETWLEGDELGCKAELRHQ